MPKKRLYLLETHTKIFKQGNDMMSGICFIFLLRKEGKLGEYRCNRIGHEWMIVEAG